MNQALGFVVVVTIVAWLYDFYNGMNDAANAIATTISTRALTPRAAILIAMVLNVVGALITTRVAKTVGKGIVDPSDIDQWVMICALIGATVWSALCTHYGIPISITHSLVGGIVGATVAYGGFGLLQLPGILKVLVAMVLSPIAGFLGGFLLMLAMVWIFRRSSPRKVNQVFRRCQIATTAFMSLTHGSNDAQNAMGVITAALVIGGFIDRFEVPLWVILGSGFFMGLGTRIGGWRVIRTMGTKMVKVRPVHGVSAEVSSALVILGFTMAGAPISTTHVVATGIMGVGAIDKLSSVRWGVAFRIVITWIFTIPSAGVIGGLAYLLIRLARVVF